MSQSISHFDPTLDAMVFRGGDGGIGRILAERAREYWRCRRTLEMFGRAGWMDDATNLCRRRAIPAAAHIKLLRALSQVVVDGRLEYLDDAWRKLVELLGAGVVVDLRYDMTAAEPVDTITPTLARLAGREVV